MKIFCSEKSPVKTIKRQAIYWWGIFSNPISEKEIVSRIYKELLKDNSGKR
jgi:hypothetical protein